MYKIKASSALIARHLLCWAPLALVAIANGALREFTYGRVLAELTSHQLSTLTAMLFSGLLVWWAHRRWPLASSRQAWFIGSAWLLGTIAFEFGFGHFVVGHAWARLLADYDISSGRVWLLFLLWIWVMPRVFFGITRSHR